MGVDLFWRPKKDKKVFQSCHGSSQAIKVEGQFGPVVSEDDLQKVNHFYEATGEEIYKEIADIVERVGAIYLEVE